MLINRLPLVAGIVPMIAITLAHWLGVRAGHLPACFPYVEGCTSISATGRHPPGSFLFKAVELPFAAILVFIWYFTVRWIAALDNRVSRSVQHWIMALGAVGAAALVIYTTFLGTHEPLYEFMRRFGIYFYFAGTSFAQLLTSISLRRHCVPASRDRLHHLSRWMLSVALLPLALGILNLVLKAVLADADTWENRIEWVAALAMQTWFVLLFVAWRATQFRVSVEANRGV